MAELTERQLEEMKHCIGYTEKRVRGRIHRRYSAFRNRYVVRCYLEHWEELVRRGLADRDVDRAYSIVHYWVTEAGMAVLSEVLGVVITEGD